MKRTRMLWLAVPLGIALLSGCRARVRAYPPPVPVSATVEVTPGYATVYPTAPPPEPIFEVRPPVPGYGYYWVDGYWDWNGYDWSWANGYWAPERPGYAYVRPRYVFEGG